MQRLFLLSLMLVTLLVPVVYSQDNFNVEQTSTLHDYWNTVYDVFVEGDYIFVAAGQSGLRIIDQRNLDELVEVGHLAVCGTSTRIFKNGNLVFLMDSPFGIRIIDVSDLQNPVELSLYESKLSYPTIAVSGNVLCLSEVYGNDICVIDITDPTDLNTVSDIQVESITSCLIKDDILYVINSVGYCYLYDVSDPSNPGLINSFYDIDGFGGLDVSGDVLYLKTGEEMIFLQLDGDYNLEELNRVGETTHRAKISVQDNSLYVVSEDYLKVYSVDEQYNMNLELEESFTIDINGYYADYDTLTTPYDAKIANNMYYGYSRLYGLDIIDISDPDNLVYRDSIVSSGLVMHSCMAEGLMYVALECGGIEVLDITDPTQPVVISIFEGIEYVNCLDYNGEYLLAADAHNGLYMVDIINPEELFVVDCYEMEEGCNFVKSYGDYVYVLNNNNCLQVYLCGDDDLIEFVCELTGYQSEIKDFCIGDEYAYGIDEESTFKIINIDNPEEITLRVDRDVNFNPYSITCNDNILFLGGSEFGGINIIHAISPLEYRILGQFETEDKNLVVEYVDGYLYVMGDSGRLEIYDVSDPVNPELVGCYAKSSGCGGITIENRYAYVANLNSMMILDCTEATNWSNFRPVSPTNHGYQINIDGVNMDQEVFSFRDEIGAFDGDVCVGSIVFDSEFPVNLQTWRRNDDLGQQGYTVGNDIVFKLWDDSEDMEYFAVATYTTGDGTFENGTYAEVNLEISFEGYREKNPLIPASFQVSSPYPNPFNSTLSIPFSIPQDGLMKFNVYNCLGQLVSRQDQWFKAGNHRYSLDSQGLSSSVRDLSSGVYYINIQYLDQSQTLKASLLK